MEIDITGAAAVAKLIEKSGFNKFFIIRIGGSKAAPIYESKTKTNVENDFLEWSRITDNSNPYEIILQMDNAKGENNKVQKFSFRIKAEEKAPQYHPQQQAQNISELISLALDKQAAQFRENEMLKEMKLLREKVEQMEAEDEDEGEEINGDQQSDLINKLMPLVNAFMGGSPQPINGVEVEETEGRITSAADRLNLALRRLKKVDSNIIADLEKLADIAEKSPTTFNLLLNQLRAM